MIPNYSAVQFIEELRGLTTKNMGLNLIDSPVLQFFKHVRNAAAHNGKFYFDKKVIDRMTGHLKQKSRMEKFDHNTNFTRSPSNCKR